MILFWGDFYYDKNIDVTPNQDLFENFSYGIETELRKNFYKDNKINPYLGFALRYGYNKSENRYIYPYSSNNEFNIENTESKQIGIAFSFGAEYFITSAVSIFAHTRIFNIYYSWNYDQFDYANNSYYEDEDKKYDSVKTTGFERSTLFIRFYF